MRHCTQLTLEQRYQISGLKKAGFNQSEIATDLNVHKLTISRELKRKKGQRGWRPRQAVRERLRAQRHAQKRISIDEHPDIVEKKERIGDWEGDTVIGKGQKGALVTLTERVLRYTLANMLSSRYAEGVTATIINLLAPHTQGNAIRCHSTMARSLPVMKALRKS